MGLREIKVRIYDPISRTMTYFSNLSYDEQNKSLIFANGQLPAPVNDNLVITIASGIKGFTVKEKKVVEIYDEDIVVYKANDIVRVSIIRFNAEGYYENHPIGYYDPKWKFFFNRWQSAIDSARIGHQLYYYLLGNTMENPEMNEEEEIFTNLVETIKELPRIKPDYFKTTEIRK